MLENCVSTIPYLLALFNYRMFSCLIMAVKQENRFVLNLALAESYIYGTAITVDN